MYFYVHFMNYPVIDSQKSTFIISLNALIRWIKGFSCSAKIRYKNEDKIEYENEDKNEDNNGDKNGDKNGYDFFICLLKNFWRIPKEVRSIVLHVIVSLLIMKHLVELNRLSGFYKSYCIIALKDELIKWLNWLERLNAWITNSLNFLIISLLSDQITPIIKRKKWHSLELLKS